MQRLKLSLTAILLIAGSLYAANDIMDYKVSGSSKFKVTSAGNTTIAGTLAVTGASTFTGAVTNTGAVANSSNVTTVGKYAFTPTAVTGLVGGTTWQIPVTSVYITVLATGTNVPLGGLPTISTATAVGGSTALADGTYLIIAGTGCPTLGVHTSSITLQSDISGGLSGSRLRLGSATRVISCSQSIGLMYDAAATAWKEIWYSNVP